MEYLPLDQLLDFAEQKLKTSVKRGLALPLYKKKWGRHPANANGVFELSELKRLPLLTQKELVASGRNITPAVLAGRHVQLWTKADCCEAEHYWLPGGLADITELQNQAGRMIHLLELSDADRVLILSQTASKAANLIPCLLIQALNAEGINCQIITLDMVLLEQVPKWIKFLTRNRPTLMMAQAGDALMLFDMFSKMQNAAGYSKADAGESGKPMSELREIMLFGRDSIAAQSRIEAVYRTDVRLSLGMADMKLGALECSMHNGIHLWLDQGLYEIIPDGYGALPESSTASLPWIWECEPETRGELVVTTFSEAQPLIRFRSGYRVETTGAETCACGRTHPRVKLLQSNI
jgi:phenylacetate-coenzyme A ligase PaaK-like adenylate-forming protein